MKLTVKPKPAEEMDYILSLYPSELEGLIKELYSIAAYTSTTPYLTALRNHLLNVPR